MTREEAIKILNTVKERGFKYTFYSVDEYYEALNMAIKTLEQEPCEDAISRQVTVEKLCKLAEFMNDKREGLGSPYVMAALFIQDNKDGFPPVITQPKMGRWVLKRMFPTKYYNENLIDYECSECGRRITCTEKQLVNYPYCHCGAKMQEEEVKKHEKP